MCSRKGGEGGQGAAVLHGRRDCASLAAAPVSHPLLGEGIHALTQPPIRGGDLVSLENEGWLQCVGVACIAGTNALQGGCVIERHVARQLVGPLDQFGVEVKTVEGGGPIKLR